MINMVILVSMHNRSFNLIDIHSHILPGIDDGSRSMSMSIEMAKQAVQIGITHMICTPHIHPGYFDNDDSSIKPVFSDLQQALIREKVPLTLTYGAEVRVSEQIPEWISNNEIPFLGRFNSKKVLLLEMPHSHVPVGIEMLIKWLLSKNVLPVIAHPERNRELLAEPWKLDHLRRTNAIFQLTAGSVTGRFGEKVQAFSRSLVRSKKIDIVASDTHNLTKRPNDMGIAYDFVSSIDQEFAKKVFFITPSQIVSSSNDF